MKAQRIDCGAKKGNYPVDVKRIIPRKKASRMTLRWLSYADDVAGASVGDHDGRGRELAAGRGQAPLGGLPAMGAADRGIFLNAIDDARRGERLDDHAAAAARYRVGRGGLIGSPGRASLARPLPQASGAAVTPRGGLAIAAGLTHQSAGSVISTLGRFCLFCGGVLALLYSQYRRGD